MKKFQIDDPLDAAAIHAGSGLVGLIASGLTHVF